jgi:hypothetical protein
MQSLLSTANVKAASLASLLLIYLVLALSVSSILYAETIHRVTTVKEFEESIFGSTLADSLAAIGFLLLFLGLNFRSNNVRVVLIALFAVAIASFVANVNQLVIAGLVSLPAATALLVAAGLTKIRKRAAGNMTFKPQISVDCSKFAAVFLGIIIIIEVGALARWISYPVYPTEIYTDPSWRVAELESALFHSFGLLSPILLVLIAFSFLYRWYMPRILLRTYNVFRGRVILGAAATAQRSKKSIDENIVRHNGNDRDVEVKGKENPLSVKQVPPSGKQRAKMLHVAVLSGALVIAPLLMIYPHLPTVNPTGQGVSTDERYYLNWMTRIRSSGDEVVAAAFTISKGDRPLTLLLIMGIANLVAIPDLTVIRYLPVALAPALVASTYLLVRHSLGVKKYEGVLVFAALAALFTAFSPQIIVGEYAGLLANWLALVAGYPALLFLIKTWDSDGRYQLALYSACLFATLLLVMLFHLYIWLHLLAVTAIFCALSYIFSKGSNSKVKVLSIVLVVAACFAFDYGRSQFFDSPQLARSDSVVGENIQSAPERGSRWDQLHFTLGTYVGGFLSSPVLFLPALAWVVAKGDLRNGLDRTLISMLFLLALPVLVGNVDFQTRVLHNTPMQIPAVLSLYPLTSHSKYRLLGVLLIVATIAISTTFALRAMANLYFVPPEGYVLGGEEILLP